MKQESASADGFFNAMRGIDEIDYEYVEAIMEGDADLFRQLLQIAVEIFPDSIDKLNDFLVRGDLAAFTIEVHGLKGSLNSIGALQLGLGAFELEKASKQGNLTYCQENIAAFAGKLGAFHRATAEVLGVATAEKESSADTMHLVERLQAAAEAAESFNNTSAFSIVKSLTRHSYGVEIDSALKEIENSLDEFECDTAASQLRVLMVAVGENANKTSI